MKKNHNNFSIRDFLSKVSYFFKTMTFARNILIFYILVTILGAFILWLPFSQTGYIDWDPLKYGNPFTKGNISFLDALFTAASAFSDTGLSTVSIAVAYTEFGQAVVAILIFLGGIGFFAFKVYIVNIIFGFSLGFRARKSMSVERGSINVGVSRQLIKIAITILLCVIVIFTIILSTYFYTTDISKNTLMVNSTKSLTYDQLLYQNPYQNATISLKFGLFHTISALNNAGFDILGNSSLQPYYFNYGIQFIFLFLFILGGIGYPVIYDLYIWSKTRFTKDKFKFSLFTKLSTTAYFLIAFLGLGVTYAIEVGSSDAFWSDASGKYGSTGDKLMAIFFNTMSTRNAGFSTIEMHDLSQATMIQYIIMMFLGSAPSSTAGGIRTTTIAIIVLTLWARLRGRTSVFAFKRRLPTDTVNRAFIVFFISTLLVIATSLIAITSFDVNGGSVETMAGLMKKGAILNEKTRAYNFMALLFESASAFGTTGLSTGITSSLSQVSKIFIIILMFIGQLGVSSTILVWGKKTNTDKHFKWIKEDVAIG